MAVDSLIYGPGVVCVRAAAPSPFVSINCNFCIKYVPWPFITR